MPMGVALNRGFVRRRPDEASRGWRGAMAETLLVGLVLVVFSRLHDAVGTDVGAATANARALQYLEHGLHLDVELATNRWLAEHEALIAPAALFYRLYYAVLLGVLVWVYIWHAKTYLQVRRTLVAMVASTFLVYWALPMSPPRFAQPGVIDIIAGNHTLAGQNWRDVSSGANFTAMPSLHVGWSALCAYAVWSALRGSHPRAALFAWLFPLVMVADVLATGSHYVLDVAGSAVLVVTSLTAASGWGRIVPRRSRPRAPPTPRRPGEGSTCGKATCAW